MNTTTRCTNHYTMMACVCSAENEALDSETGFVSRYIENPSEVRSSKLIGLIAI